MQAIFEQGRFQRLCTDLVMLGSGYEVNRVHKLFHRLCQAERGKPWLSSPIREGSSVRPLEIACAIGADLETIALLLKEPDLDYHFEAGVTAAGWCAQRGDLERLSSLISVGALSPSHYDAEGMTLLHRAAMGSVAGLTQSNRRSKHDPVWNPNGAPNPDLLAIGLEMHAAYTAVRPARHQEIFTLLKNKLGFNWFDTVSGNSPYLELAGKTAMELLHQFQPDVAALVAEDSSQAEEYVVEVSRSSPRSVEISVTACSEAQAHQKALDQAVNIDFAQGSSGDAEYVVLGARRVNPSSNPAPERPRC